MTWMLIRSVTTHRCQVAQYLNADNVASGWRSTMIDLVTSAARLAHPGRIRSRLQCHSTTRKFKIFLIEYQLLANKDSHRKLLTDKQGSPAPRRGASVSTRKPVWERDMPKKKW